MEKSPAASIHSQQSNKSRTSTKKDSVADGRTTKKEQTASSSVEDVEKSAGIVSGKQPEALSKSESKAVDGGFWGWSTVLGAWLFQFTGFGYSNAFGVYQDYYTRVYLTSYTSSDISWIGSVQVFLLMGSGFISGRFFDKGYFYHLSIFGSILLVFSVFMLSLCKEDHFYQIFLSQGLGIGLASGMMYVPSYGVVAQHFPSPHMRALTMGLVASGSSLGGLLHPIMLNNLFHGHVGFANGVRASAGLIAGMQLIAVLLMRTKYPDKAVVKTIALKDGLKKFSKDVPYILLAGGMFLFAQGLFFPIFYLQLDSVLHGLDANFSFYSLAILNGASIIGRIVPGFLARQFGVFNMLTLSALCCSVLVWSMFGALNVPGVVLIAMLFGFFSGSYVTLLGPALALLATDPTEIGMRMGLAFVFTALGSLIGTPINGALLSTHFTWWRPIVYSGVVCCAAVCLFMSARIFVARRRNPRTWIV